MPEGVAFTPPPGGLGLIIFISCRIILPTSTYSYSGHHFAAAHPPCPKTRFRANESHQPLPPDAAERSAREGGWASPEREIRNAGSPDYCRCRFDHQGPKRRGRSGPNRTPVTSVRRRCPPPRHKRARNAGTRSASDNGGIHAQSTSGNDEQRKHLGW